MTNDSKEQAQGLPGIIQYEDKARGARNNAAPLPFT
jgi:hypothetical protein